MKKFVTHTAILLFLVVMAGYFCEKIITNNLHKSKAKLFCSWNEIFFENTKYDALIMGSSRGLVQYNPAFLDSVLGITTCNISIDGRGINDQIVKYNVYRLYHAKPKLIIQNVDFCALGKSNGYEREQFLPYLFCDSLYYLTKNTEGFSWYDKFLPLVKYAGYFEVIKEGLNIHNKLPKPLIYNGFIGIDSKWNGSLFSTIKEVILAKDPEVIDSFKNYLSKCKNDSIQVILVFAPIYIGVTQKMQNPQEMFDFFGKIAEQFNYPILNYTYNYLSFDTTYFYNATHLNSIGASLFSKQLACSVDSLRKIGTIKIN